MRAIELSLLNHYADRTAVLFTHEGIVVDAQTSSPMLPFQIVRQLGLIVHAAYLEQATLILKCHNILSPEKMLHQGFVTHKPKSFLYQTHQQPLRTLILRAIHCLSWDSKLQYCSQCAEKLQKNGDKIEKYCPNCKLSFSLTFLLLLWF